MRKLVLLVAVAAGFAGVSIRREARAASESPACAVPKSWGLFRGIVNSGSEAGVYFEAPDGTIRIVGSAFFKAGSRAADRCVGRPLEPDMEIRRSE